MKETELQKLIRTSLSINFGHLSFNLKIHPDIYMEHGIPDIISCVMGRFVGIEAKIYPNRPSDEQIRMMRKIRSAGGISYYLIRDNGNNSFYWVNGDIEIFSYRLKDSWFAS